MREFSFLTPAPPPPPIPLINNAYAYAYGIVGNILNWITAFLSNRSQIVRVNGAYSKSSQVISGIPQGSVLGPILFVIYINDLPDAVNSSKFLFADDTKIL